MQNFEKQMANFGILSSIERVTIHKHRRSPTKLGQKLDAPPLPHPAKRF